MSDDVVIGVLVPLWREMPKNHPSALPLGAAALALEGTRVVFGGTALEGRLVGHEATPHGWRKAALPVHCAWDRFPSQSHPQAYEDLLANLPGVRIGTPTGVMELCRDKVRCQRTLEAAGIEHPELITAPERFDEALARWKHGGFAKPQHGSLGRGVRHVHLGDEVLGRGPGAVPGKLDNIVLQQAVAPPPGWAGISVRALVQRERGAWQVAPIVARCSRHDPVVNVARSAQVLPAEQVLSARTCEQIRRISLEIAAVIGQDPLALELGIDLVIDDEGRPWPIEVNGRPRGRLEALASQSPASYAQAHLDACARPLRELHRLCSDTTA